MIIAYILGAFMLVLLTMLALEVWVSRRAWALYQEWVEEHEYDHDTEVDLVWNFVVGANKRRKRFEKLLKRERAEHMKVSLSMSRHIHEVSQEFEQLQDKYYALAADVVESLLVEQEKEKIVKKLTRKVRKKKEPK